MNTFGKLAFSAAMVCVANAKDLIEDGRKLQSSTGVGAFPRDWEPEITPETGDDYHEGEYHTWQGKGVPRATNPIVVVGKPKVAGKDREIVISTRLQVPPNCDKVSLEWWDSQRGRGTKLVNNMVPDDDGYAVVYNMVAALPQEADDEIDANGYTVLSGWCQSPRISHIWTEWLYFD